MTRALADARSFSHGTFAIPARVRAVTAQLPDDALVPATAAVPDLLGPHRAGQTLAGARGKEGLSQRQLAALTVIPQRHISEMENAKRPIGKANAKILGKALKVDYRVLL